MRYGKTLMCIVPLLAVAACDDDGITGPRATGDMAVVRFVNVVADTGTVDFRFIDRVENLPTLLGRTFRAYSGVYQRTPAGARPARVFPFSHDAGLTQIMLVDTTLTLAANGRYTFVYAGLANGNQDRLHVFEDPATIPSPPAGNIGVKVLHGGVGMGSVDVYAVAVATTTTDTPADWQTTAIPVTSGTAYLTQSGYVNLPVLDDGFYRFVVTAAGSTTPLFAATPNLPGAEAPAGASYGDDPGVRIDGSVLTLVVAPGSVPGTRESTTSTQTPTTFFMIDKTLDP